MVKNYLTGHLVAIFGAVALHGGIAAWAMRPSAPIAIPQQQIIQISMVAPSSVAQKAVEAEAPDLSTPPATDGLRQIKQKDKKSVKNKQKEKKTAQKASQNLVTSGRQSKDSLQKNAAITKPLFSANYLNNPPPVYPKSARNRNLQGLVMLEVLVSEKGEAKRVNVEKSSGFGVLDNAALSAVQQWKFVPAHRGSEIVEARVLVPVEFKLN